MKDSWAPQSSVFYFCLLFIGCLTFLFQLATMSSGLDPAGKMDSFGLVIPDASSSNVPCKHVNVTKQ